MPAANRFRVWLRRISIASLVLLIGLEIYALVAPKMRMIQTSPTSEMFIHVGVARIGVIKVEEPTGLFMPFVERPGSHNDLAPGRPVTNSRLHLPLLWMHENITHRIKRGGGVIHMSFWAVDYFPLALMGAAWPLVVMWEWGRPKVARWIAALRWRRAIRRAAMGLDQRCPRCGYDLRASTDRCPECGASFTRRTVIVPEPVIR